MSTSIEFRHRAFVIRDTGIIQLAIQRLEGEKHDPHPHYEDPVFLVLVERGANNVTEMSGRIARDTVIGFVGHADDVMRGACTVAARGVVGGMVRFGERRRLLPEAYISRYRRTLSDAADAREVLARLEAVTIYDGALEGPLVRHPRWKAALAEGRVTLGEPGKFQGAKLTIPNTEEGLADLATLALYARDDFEQANWTSRYAGTPRRLDSLMD